jgi:predicted O-methyltransferase YrrM
MMDELPPNPVLREMLSSRVVADAAGRQRALYAGISPRHAMALYRTVLKHRPRNLIEIGMCLGVSTLSILTALNELGDGGQLISIDPLQTRNEKGIGLLNVQKAGFASAHRLIEKPSHVALPELLAAGHSIDFAYVDGSHEFEDVLVDFFYLDKMLRVDGVIAFNDCGWPSVHAAVGSVLRTKRYEELDAGLAKDFSGRNALFTLARRIRNRSRSDRYFQKRKASAEIV